MAATQTTDEMTYAEALDECEEADREACRSAADCPICGGPSPGGGACPACCAVFGTSRDEEDC